jgi:ferritin
MHMRKVKENLNLKSELHERLGYRNVGDYSGMEDYNPFLQTEFQEKRNKLMKVIRKINNTGWTYHLDALEQITDPAEQETYISEKVSDSDRDIVRAALTY